MAKLRFESVCVWLKSPHSSHSIGLSMCSFILQTEKWQQINDFFSHHQLYQAVKANSCSMETLLSQCPKEIRIGNAVIEYSGSDNALWENQLLRSHWTRTSASGKNLAMSPCPFLIPWVARPIHPLHFLYCAFQVLSVGKLYNPDVRYSFQYSYWRQTPAVLLEQSWTLASMQQTLPRYLLLGWVQGIWHGF